MISIFPRPVQILVALVWLTLLGALAPARGQVEGGLTNVSRPVVESRIEEVQAATDLDEETRAALIETYRGILGYLEIARANSAAADKFAQARESAPEETGRLRDALEKAQADSPTVELDIATDVSAREIEQRLQLERANQAAVEARVNNIEQQGAAAANRPAAVRQRLVEVRQLSDQLAADLALQAPAEELPLLAEARRWSLQAQVAALNAENRMLDQELLSQSARIDLLRAQRDSSTRSLGRIETRVKMLEELLVDRRRSETEQVIANSDAAVLGEAADHPLIQKFVEANRTLGDNLQLLTDRLESLAVENNSATDKLREIQSSFQIARQRLEIAGLSQALGQVLHDQRRDLPDIRQYRSRARKREEAIVEAGLRDIQLESEWRQSEDVNQYVDSLLIDLPAAEREELSEPLTRLVSNRRTLLKNAIAANNQYLRELGDLDFQEQQLQSVAAEFDAFLVEVLLWVRGTEAIGIDSVLNLPAEIIDFLAPNPWLEALGILWDRSTSAPWLILGILVSGLLLWQRAHLAESLRLTASAVGQPAIDTFGATLKAISLSVLLIMPYPLLTLVGGWEISQYLDASDGAKAIGIGLLRLTPALFFLRTFRVLCIDGGLAAAHFGWSATAVRTLRFQLDQLLLTFLLPAFVLVTSFSRYESEFGGELARITFVIATAGITAFLIRLLHPRRGVLREIWTVEGKAHEVSAIWLGLAVVVPVSLAIAALGGYVYSAITLMTALVRSLWLVFGLIVAHALVERWLLVVRGRLLLKAARERSAADRIESEKKRAEASAGEDLPPLLEEPELDVASLDADTRKLLTVALLVAGVIGMGAIWSDILPALVFFNQITLWQYFEGTGADQQLVPVTLGDFLLAVVYLFITVVAVRTVPSVLEAILRQRETITPGTRLAFATLTRYGVVLLGVSLIAGTIGFNWGKIQWLIAALGVGIGFGLQEIVANFISGLIILVERPIRVGDLVTVGDTSGTVSRLQIRATTVTNFNRQELLVPNKEFITGRVLNWSLSDEVLRITVQVGVAYGSDIRRALECVREAVVAHPLVLADPEPLITFDEFGNSSLNITARFFINEPNMRRETISDVNLAINEKLKDAGIVIAFPQRDVHLDTSAPLDVRIRND